MGSGRKAAAAGMGANGSIPGGEATGSEAEKAQWDEVENGGRREHRDRSPGGRCDAPT